MEIPHRDLATARAADLVVKNLGATLNDTTASAKKLSDAIIPLFGIRWNIDVIRRVGARELRHVLWRLRNSKLSDRDYNRVRELWEFGVAEGSASPAAWETWRTLIERFNLDDERPWADWFVLVDTLKKIGWNEPTNLAKIEAATFNAFREKYSFHYGSIQIWRAAVLVFTDTSAGSAITLKGACEDAESLFNSV